MRVITDAIIELDNSPEQASRARWEGHLKHIHRLVQKYTQQRQDAKLPGEIDLDVFPPILELLKFVLRLDPRIRPSASEVLRRLPETLMIDSK